MDFYVVFTLQMMIVCSQGVLCYWFWFLCGSSRENVTKFWRGDMPCRHGKHFCHFVAVTFLYCPSFHKRPSAQVQREVDSPKPNKEPTVLAAQIYYHQELPTEYIVFNHSYLPSLKHIHLNGACRVHLITKIPNILPHTSTQSPITPWIALS